ncbi:MAG: ATP synthase F1 subunit gamma [Erysipelotrichaceae bacterium]|nr:ATP synthase F1 subunit gamma [Erysipelotrichaceae bacterium]
MSVAMHATKRRIRSIQSTAKITRAMGLVAVTRLKTWQRKFMANRVFANQLGEILEEALKGIDKETHPYLTLNKQSSKVLHVVISSSLGLAGPYNNNITEATAPLINEGDEVIMIGKRGKREFSRLGITCNDMFLELNISYDDVSKLGAHLRNEYDSGNYERVVIHYTNYINSMTSEVKHVTLLPFGISETYLDPVELDEADEQLIAELGIDDDEEADFDLSIESIIEPDKPTFFQAFIPIYLNNMLYAYVIAAQVAEQSSRRLAMDLATDNANEMIDELMIKYNAARQAAITQEITEIVSGLY